MVGGWLFKMRITYNEINHKCRVGERGDFYKILKHGGRGVPCTQNWWTSTIAWTKFWADFLTTELMCWVPALSLSVGEEEKESAGKIGIIWYSHEGFSSCNLGTFCNIFLWLKLTFRPKLIYSSGGMDLASP